jgi:hypothetical protein
MLNESKLELSKDLFDLIISMPKDRIRDCVMDLFQKGKDIELRQNYLDIGKKNDEITFIADSRVKSITRDYKQMYKIRHRGGRLTFNTDENGRYKNQDIFDDLGFDPDTATRDTPSVGDIGEILAQTPSRETEGKIYVLFKWGENLSVYNKNSLQEEGDMRSRIESLTRNPTTIFRAVRAILNSSGEKFTDKEVETFGNNYKASYDMSKDAMNKLKVVSGEDIPYWYNYNRYMNMNGSLGGSCMKDVRKAYFDIYSKNPDVCSMLILYAAPYRIGEDGKPTSNIIKGRALLWTTDSGELYMDRIYTNDDSDTSLFKKWAEENGYWSKKRQCYGTPFDVELKGQTKQADWTISISKFEFDYYPYVDSFQHMDEHGNISCFESGQKWALNDTSGDRNISDNYSGDEDED